MQILIACEELERPCIQWIIHLARQHEVSCAGAAVQYISSRHMPQAGPATVAHCTPCACPSAQQHDAIVSANITGDTVELKQAMRELQQQLNHSKQTNKMLHAENQRLTQHLKGLESTLVQESLGDTSASTPGAHSTGNSIAAGSRWSIVRASTAPGGSLRASMAGGASTIRAFSRAVSCQGGRAPL